MTKSQAASFTMGGGGQGAKFDPNEFLNDPTFDSETEYYDSEEERAMEAATKNAEGIVDPDYDYRKWLKKWGTVDFDLMFFTPVIQTRREMEALMKIKWYSDQRRLRVKKYIKGHGLDEIDEMDAEQKRRLGLPENSMDDEDYENMDIAKSSFMMATWFYTQKQELLDWYL